MNCPTRTTYRSGIQAAIGTACTAVFALAFTTMSPSARADEPPHPAPTVSRTVSLAGLDLSTPEGAHAAYERLRRAAERLCFELEDERTISHQATYFYCVKETLASTIQQINSPMVAALAR